MRWCTLQVSSLRQKLRLQLFDKEWLGNALIGEVREAPPE